VYSQVVDENASSEGGKIGALKKTIDSSQENITAAIKQEIKAELKAELDKLKIDFKMTEATILSKLDSLASDAPRIRAASGEPGRAPAGRPAPARPTTSLNFIGKQMSRIK
jgi:hypothetical protein